MSLGADLEISDALARCKDSLSLLSAVLDVELSAALQHHVNLLPVMALNYKPAPTKRFLIRVAVFLLFAATEHWLRQQREDS